MKRFLRSFSRSDVRESYHEDLKNFTVESRKLQTLYANCEGSYERRVINIEDDLYTLHNFVYCTMYYEQGQGWDNEQDFSKREQVENICQMLIKNSETKEEIVLRVTWIYYISYKDKNIQAIPIFKVYKNKSDDRAVFLDPSLKLYESWDSYVDNCRNVLHVSLLCVPRNGDYGFVKRKGEKDEELELEFLLSKNMTLNKNIGNQQSAKTIKRRYKAYFQTAIRPWLSKKSKFTPEKLRQIKIILTNMGFTLENLFKYSKVIIFVIFVIFVVQKYPLTEALKMITDGGLMLLNNVRGKEDSSESGLQRSVCFDLLTNAFTSFEMKESMTVLQYEGRYFAHLLKNDVKNWYEIIKTFCQLLRNGARVLLEISHIIPFPPVLKKLILLVADSIFLKEFLLKNTREDCKTDVVKYSKIISPNKSSQLILKNKTSEVDEDVNVFNGRALDEFLPNLFQLETTSPDRMIAQLLGKSNELWNNQTPSNFFFLGEEDDYGFFFVLRASFPSLTKIITNLFGKDFTLKPEEETICDIFLPGEIRGTIFFPQEFTAVALFPLTALKHQEICAPNYIDQF